MRILFAEDDAPLRAAIGEELAEAGHDVIAVPDGDALLEEILHLHRQRTPPDVVVLDLWMPRMSGEQVAAFMRRQRIMQIPTVVITATGKEVWGHLTGRYPLINTVLLKPFPIDDLLAALRRVEDARLQQANSQKTLCILCQQAPCVCPEIL